MSPVTSAIEPDVAVTSAAVMSAEVHEAGRFTPGVLRWGYFLVLNAIAAAIAGAFFVAVFYADGLDPYLQGTYEWLLAHPGVTSLAAFSPLACSLLVGYGYAQRARRRRLSSGGGPRGPSLAQAARTASE